MGATGDTLMRHWEILSRIPREPSAISTAAIRDALKDLGYQVTDRTVQRNLEVLSASFPLKSTKHGQTNYWSWMATAPSRTVPALDPATALAVTLARDYLRPLLPPATLKLLDPYFKSAAAALARDYAVSHARLQRRLRVLARGPHLLPARVKPQVQDAIYEALLKEQQVEITYRSRAADAPNTFPLHPLGLVAREGVLYAVGTLWAYEDLRHFALHRIDNAQVLAVPCRRPADFDLGVYIEQEGVFGYPTGQGEIRLKALFERDAAFHLRERRLAKDQEITNVGDGWVLVEATVLDTHELRWWLLGFGRQVRVLEPDSLRKEFQGIARDLAHLYRG